MSREILPVGYLKGQYKSESSLMTCEAELHGSVTPTRMPSSILSLIGNYNCCSILLYFPRPRPRTGQKLGEAGGVRLGFGVGRAVVKSGYGG